MSLRLSPLQDRWALYAIWDRRLIGFGGRFGHSRFRPVLPAELGGHRLPGEERGRSPSLACGLGSAALLEQNGREDDQDSADDQQNGAEDNDQASDLTGDVLAMLSK